MSLKMLSTEWTSCNLLPQLGKLPNCKQTFVDGKSKEKFVLGKEENYFFKKRLNSHELNLKIIQKKKKKKKKKIVDQFHTLHKFRSLVSNITWFSTKSIIRKNFC